MVAATMCGLVFGWGLLISEMTQPTKVIGFLDVFGTWDPSLGVVMAAALAVSSIGLGMPRRERVRSSHQKAYGRAGLRSILHW